MILLMFIGGGSLSTASGIKVGTFIVLVAATYSYIFRRSEVVVFKRSVSSDLVHKALALLLVTITLVFVAVFLISIFDKAPLVSIVFEVVSAISRSEEHTSELQSLMRTSYAVFCLKKKKHNITIQTTNL